MAFDDRFLSALIQQQIPEVLATENPTFVAFLKAYYEFLEQSGQATNASRNLLNFNDLDNTTQDILKYIESEIAEGIPEQTEANQRLLLKNLRELYQAKSTEEAFKFIFKALFNEDIEIITPSDNILRVSDGRWTVDTVMRVQAPDNIFDAVGQQIRGLQSNSTAFINGVTRERVTSIEVSNLFLNDVSGTFFDTEIVRGSFANGSVFNLNPFSIVTSVNVDSPGSGYSVGDTVTIADASGQGALASVKSIDDNTGIKKVLSSDQVIQDSNFYQIFSYVIRSGIVTSRYRDVVRKILQPAGIAQFGQVLINVVLQTEFDKIGNTLVTQFYTTGLDVQIDKLREHILILESTEELPFDLEATRSAFLNELTVFPSPEPFNTLDFTFEEEDLELSIARIDELRAGTFVDLGDLSISDLSDYNLYNFTVATGLQGAAVSSNAEIFAGTSNVAEATASSRTYL